MAIHKFDELEVIVERLSRAYSLNPERQSELRRIGREAALELIDKPMSIKAISERIARRMRSYMERTGSNRARELKVYLKKIYGEYR